MKLLLLEDIDKLGYLGDVVEVKNGYARNYLLPQGLATAPNEGNMRAIADEKAKRAEQRKLDRKRSEKVVEAIEGAEAVVSAKSNTQGHLFGSITAKEIGENLRKQGFEIKDSAVKLGEHIKEVGSYTVKIRLAEDLIAQVNVVVVGLDAEGNPIQFEQADEYSDADEAYEREDTE